MDLYLILLTIAGLGIFAILLIFWGRIKPAKNITPLEPKLNLSAEEEKTEPYIGEELQLDLNALNTQDNKAFSSLGFDTLEGLLPDVQPEPEFSSPAQVTRITQKSSVNGREFIIFYLLAPKNRPFVGYELLQALLAAGLKFGDMSIFHRYAGESETKTPLFSVASAVKPGTFDLANIGAFSCPGLSLFLSVPGNINLTKAFETMIETAMQLADDLEGTLCDDERKNLTPEMLQSYREQIYS